MRATRLVSAAASLALYHPAPAHACTQPPCWPAAFVPGDQSKLPANVPGLFWRPMSGPLATSDPKNVILASAAAPRTPIAFTAQPYSNGDYLLTPSAPLAPGGYILADHNTCSLTGKSGPEVAFTVGDTAPLPVDLGVLIAAAPRTTQLELETRDGSCSSRATVNEITFELVPSAAAMAWFDALHFETLVDGRPWTYQTSLDARVPPGASPTGRGRDRVFAVCASDDPSQVGLSPGRHLVTMQATLPGTKDMVVSTSLDLMLRCAPSSEPVPAEPPDPPRGDEPDGGGCTTASSPTTAALPLALLALRGLALRRRRTTQRA